MKKTLLCLLLAGLTSTNAQTVQEQFTDLIKDRNDILSSLIKGLPVSEFSYTLAAFTPNSPDSSAKTQITLALPEETYRVSSNATVTEGEGDVAFSSVETFSPDKSLSGELQLFLMQSEINAKRMKSGATTTIFQAKPTRYFNKDNESVNFKGATLTLNADASDNQTFDLDYSGYRALGEIRDYDLKPFNIEGEHFADGRFNFTSTPIEFIGAQKEKKGNGRIEKLSGKGNLKKHADSDIMLGSVNVMIDNLVMDGQNRIRFKKLNYNADAELAAEDRVNQSQTVTIVADQASILNMTKNQFGFTTAKVDVNVSNISPKDLKQYGDSLRKGANINTAGPEEMEEILALIQSFRETNVTLNVNLDVSSSKGPIQVSAVATFKNSGPSAASMLQSKDPKVFLHLANFDIDISLPKKLINKLGAASPMPPQMFMQLKGKSYVANIKNRNGSLTINGQPAPF